MSENAAGVTAGGASSAGATAADGAAVDPCALVTAAEASDARGAAAKGENPPEAHRPPVMVACRDTAPRGQGLALMSLIVRHGYSDAEAKSGFQATREVVPGTAERLARTAVSRFP